jgi:hypothetical protein
MPKRAAMVFSRSGSSCVAMYTVHAGQNNPQSAALLLSGLIELVLIKSSSFREKNNKLYNDIFSDDTVFSFMICIFY